MKEAGVKPNTETYDHILRACGDIAAQAEAWAVFEDMISVGAIPTRNTFHQLLYTMRYSRLDHTYDVLKLMDEHNVAKNETTYEFVICRLIQQENLELGLQWLAEMSKEDLSPTMKTIQSLVQLAADKGHARLAIELAVNFEQSTPRILEASAWYHCLIAAADSLYPDGVVYAWDKVVHAMRIPLDEGCCQAVLHTAGRNGLKDLALEAIRQLKAIGVTWKEHHFAPLVEAFCRAGDIREGFASLSLIRQYGVDPTLETAYPIFQAISQSDEKVDEAWGILEELKNEGRTIDVVAYNSLIQACVAIGDLQRSLGTYKAASDLGVKPDIETFNLLLSACIAAEHRELGDRLLTEMREANIRPNERTYERLIVLCLTQATYEDAFYYLEEMKTVKLKPSQAIYEAIIRKCVFVGDTRYKLAVEEMTENGYEVSKKLQEFIDNGGQTPKDRVQKNRSR
ncbi:hypothetical protein BDY19DRAFT_897240 [Irpex rosettiformis]|uniref:Uncharacterized protein n=1 Tax=Irpex rosettiformis TaxID=378272 RepID=A0ACB8TT49_9APHY|nr:hypothetical protein BDY19DRAFT_897240 [Irpex rosettiformis]